MSGFFLLTGGPTRWSIGQATLAGMDAGLIARPSRSQTQIQVRRNFSCNDRHKNVLGEATFKSPSDATQLFIDDLSIIHQPIFAKIGATRTSRMWAQMHRWVLHGWMHIKGQSVRLNQ